MKQEIIKGLSKIDISKSDMFCYCNFYTGSKFKNKEKDNGIKV